MRHLLFLFALALGLAACDDATTAPAETIPGPGENPRLSVTVLTGTKAAPVDSPTVKVQWWYKDSAKIVIAPYSTGGYAIDPNVNRKGLGDTIVKFSCGKSDSTKVYVAASDVKMNYMKIDTVFAYCKAP
jgi:hypothetical protein